MIHTSEKTERHAAMRCAELMAAAARTAPKACAVDMIETLVLDGEDKDRLSTVMRRIGTEADKPFFVRDAGNIDACHCVVLVAGVVDSRALDCGFCGIDDCASARQAGIACAVAVTDIGIALSSAALCAMDHRMDNRVLFTAGLAALDMGLFDEDVQVCYGLGLSVMGKNIFFDRQGL
ncbi:MAG: DUF2148 domain-containing protein [Eggerthellaceae bacterium]|jgi:uncharacterized ferredoxin-like protein|nr:DUF2148 domain-containing protein [Eggerthellaceae bacterium]MDR2716362.1 DUF2148 domain-containing protein [Coriobacteriaceae bacterium]